MPENTDVRPALGRRDRKRLETRNALAAVALTLFAERGFDAVTVVDIADRADVDPSTFFRHFGSKEAVIFSDLGDWTGRLGDAVRGQPAELPILEAMRAGMKDLAVMLMVDIDNERRRAELIRSSPSVRAHGLAIREALIDDMTLAVADRMGVDPAGDGRPHLLAASLILAGNWYRNNVVQTGDVPSTADDAVDRIIDLLQGFVTVVAEQVNHEPRVIQRGRSRTRGAGQRT
jgi:AcrR family transcriptional regulator